MSILIVGVVLIVIGLSTMVYAQKMAYWLPVLDRRSDYGCLMNCIYRWLSEGGFFITILGVAYSIIGLGYFLG